MGAVFLFLFGSCLPRYAQLQIIPVQAALYIPKTVGQYDPVIPLVIELFPLQYDRLAVQMEVAAEIGISQAQVSRLEKGALLHLKKYM